MLPWLAHDDKTMTALVVHLLHSIDKATHHSLIPVTRQRACERHLRHLSAMEPEERKASCVRIILIHVCIEIIYICQQAKLGGEVKV